MPARVSQLGKTSALDLRHGHLSHCCSSVHVANTYLYGEKVR